MAGTTTPNTVRAESALFTTATNKSISNNFVPPKKASSLATVGMTIPRLPVPLFHHQQIRLCPILRQRLCPILRQRHCLVPLTPQILVPRKLLKMVLPVIPESRSCLSPLQRIDGRDQRTSFTCSTTQHPTTNGSGRSNASSYRATASTKVQLV